MTRRSAIIGIALLVLGAGVAWAHDGHSHTVMGTVTASHANQIELKKADGTSVTITLTDKTTVVRGKDKLTIGDLATGQRVVVDVGDGKAPLTARRVKVGPEKLAVGSRQ